jgi:CheY-like chemotaxis protein
MAKTVLIVEDNELNMKLFRDLLEAHGYQTSGTSNGFEALDLVRKTRPDLILSPASKSPNGSRTIPSCAPFRSLPSLPLR